MLGSVNDLETYLVSGLVELVRINITKGFSSSLGEVVILRVLGDQLRLETVEIRKLD